MLYLLTERCDCDVMHSYFGSLKAAQKEMQRGFLARIGLRRLRDECEKALAETGKWESNLYDNEKRIDAFHASIDDFLDSEAYSWSITPVPEDKVRMNAELNLLRQNVDDSKELIPNKSNGIDRDRLFRVLQDLLNYESDGMSPEDFRELVDQIGLTSAELDELGMTDRL